METGKFIVIYRWSNSLVVFELHPKRPHFAPWQVRAGERLGAVTNTQPMALGGPIVELRIVHVFLWDELPRARLPNWNKGREV